jgi:hypothetical protein
MGMHFPYSAAHEKRARESHDPRGLFHLASRVRYPDGAGPAAGDRQVPEPAVGRRKTSSRQLAQHSTRTDLPAFGKLMHIP